LARIDPNALLHFARNRLLSFSCALWPGYDPATHHRLIAQKLEQVERGEIKRLMIFMPPRHGKSMLCSEFFPAWCLGRNPERQIIAATYAQELASDFGRKVRNWFKDEVEQAIFPDCQLSGDSSAADRFNVGSRGAYYAVGLDTIATGRGADLLLIDDPIKNREAADSAAIRRKTKDWYTSTAYTRLMPGAAIVIIQTRWHPDDLAGWILKEHQHENWEVLSLSAISEAGDALWPERYPLDALERIKKTLPTRDWEAMYQQKPIIDGGNILKRKWWRLWQQKTPECFFILHSWDTAYSEDDLKHNSASARTAWGVFKDENGKPCALMLNAWSGFVDYPELKKEALRAYAADKPDCVLIEKKASGQSLIQDLRNVGVPVMAYQPDRDKVARAYAVQAMLESGQIYYPDRKWPEAVLDECAAFPNGTNDDFVDTCTQAWLYIRNSGMLRAERTHELLTEANDALFERAEKPRSRTVYG